MIDRKSVIPDGRLIPVPQDRRNSTDVVCTICSAIFALVMFIFACVYYSTSGVHSAYFGFENVKGTAHTIGATNFYGFLNAFWIVIVTAIGLGLLWMAIVHGVPRRVPKIVPIAAAFCLIALGIIIIVASSAFYNHYPGWKIIIAIICFLLAILCLCIMFFYRTELLLQGIFLEYARRFLLDWIAVYAYIPLFVLFMAGLVALFMFQHLAYSSKGVANSDFWNFANPGVLGIFNILEFIWAFQFLRDAFSFCVSGSATDWYWGTLNTKCSTSLTRLLTRHWGSVVGGSFMNGFFELPILFVELFTCHSTTCCVNKLGNTCDKCCCACLFSYVRTDAYSYINLAGVPFCNAGTECYQNCRYAENHFVGWFNPMKHYKFMASVLLTTLMYILGSIYVNKRVYSFHWWENVVLIVISFATVCWFIDISANAAEGILTSYLTEYRLGGGYDKIKWAEQIYSTQIQNAVGSVKKKDGYF